MSDRSRDGSQSKRRKKPSLFTLVMLILCAYLLVSIVTTRIEIYREKKTADIIERKIAETRLANDEIERMMTDGESEYIERVARDKLGYASIDERVYIDINA